MAIVIAKTVRRNKFLFNETNRRTNFPNLFCQETLHVSGSSSAHHQEFFTVHSALVYVIKPAWHIPVPNVQWKTPNDEQRKCPKHVVSWQNKFGKLVRLLVLLKRNNVSSVTLCKNNWQVFKVVLHTKAQSLDTQAHRKPVNTWNQTLSITPHLSLYSTEKYCRSLLSCEKWQKFDTASYWHKPKPHDLTSTPIQWYPNPNLNSLTQGLHTPHSLSLVHTNVSLEVHTSYYVYVHCMLRNVSWTWGFSPNMAPTVQNGIKELQTRTKERITFTCSHIHIAFDGAVWNS
jgi:hypothetical protein